MLVNEVLQRTSCDYNSMPVNTHVAGKTQPLLLSFISSAFLFPFIGRIKLLLPLIRKVKNPAMYEEEEKTKYDREIHA